MQNSSILLASTLGKRQTVMLSESYVHGASSANLLGQTLGANFDSAAERWGDREALVVRHQNLRWSYNDLKMRVDAFAAGLLSLGLEP